MYNGTTANDIAMNALRGKTHRASDVVYMITQDPRCAPRRAHLTDAGADLVSSETLEIYPNEMRMVDTGVAVAVPVGYVGLVCSRSGQGKLRISLSNSVGVIDPDYRGNIKVMIVNEGDDPYKIKAYETKIAQLIIMPIKYSVFEEWDQGAEAWNNTVRGTNGFGSTN